MSKSVTKDQETFTPEQFAEAYNQLCEKYGYSIQVVPKMAGTIHGSTMMSLELAVVKIEGK